MTRPNVTQGVSDSLEEYVIRPVTLVFLDFPDEPVYIWSGRGNLEFEGNNFIGVGDLGAISVIEETSTLKASNIDLELNGIPRQDLSLVRTTLDSHYQGRDVRVWQGFMDKMWELIPDPILVWIGRMDTPQITSSGDTVSVQLTAEHELVDMDRARIRRYTNQDQQIDYPGDRGLEFVVALQEKEIVWGREFTR